MATAAEYQGMTTSELPVFDTRRAAEDYAEGLAMRGYEHSMGYDVRVVTLRSETGYVEYGVRMSRNGNWKP